MTLRAGMPIERRLTPASNELQSAPLPCTVPRLHRLADSSLFPFRGRKLRRAMYCTSNAVIGSTAAQIPSHGDRKSTRLNSSHTVISYAVFCLKKKKEFIPSQDTAYS